MLTLEPLTEQSKWYEAAMALYDQAFPANERRPLEPILQDTSNKSQALTALDGNVFVGFAMLLVHGDIAHIIYFAVEERLRDHGYGSRILSALRDKYPASRLVVDVEEPCGAENDAERASRIAFYERNGYRMTEIRYSWIEERYAVMSMGGTVSNREFEEFWEYFYGLDEGFDY